MDSDRPGLKRGSFDQTFTDRKQRSTASSQLITIHIVLHLQKIKR